MSAQIDPQEKADRCRRLSELEARLRARYFESLRGRQLDVLVESTAGSEGRVVGTSCRYAPVELPGTAALVGDIIPATAGPVVDGTIQAHHAGDWLSPNC